MNSECANCTIINYVNIIKQKFPICKTWESDPVFTFGGAEKQRTRHLFFYDKHSRSIVRVYAIRIKNKMTRTILIKICLHISSSQLHCEKINFISRKFPISRLHVAFGLMRWLITIPWNQTITKLNACLDCLINFKQCKQTQYTVPLFVQKSSVEVIKIKMPYYSSFTYNIDIVDFTKYCSIMLKYPSHFVQNNFVSSINTFGKQW